ncbi:hypothetical protein PFFVO_02276 [Plasmodium falciparum Vietnam Oak-Knoll (FVO)]|uniref:Uncharacterized protein n=1 Tax=Plasmodium falciparum Vietnam Oak-Knoll (FVO) TaxID=1036723 RepID=A0A024V781_PLAFA|nr:hypothetical protein PFFVO_02276 [Plasmodium falciparum Vietnam Oak-Knoll (FVO)]
MLLKCINLCKNNFEFNCFVEYTEIFGYINNYYINHINVIVFHIYMVHILCVNILFQFSFCDV